MGEPTEPVHIDEAIEVEQVARDYYSNLAGMEEAEAEAAGWVAALQSVTAGKVITDDKERADRMTRVLAAAWDQGLLVVHARTPIHEAVVEALRWVEANPEMNEHEEWLADLRADRSANMKDVG